MPKQAHFVVQGKASNLGQTAISYIRATLPTLDLDPSSVARISLISFAGAPRLSIIC